MPEGTLVFPGEPMLRLTAPIIEGQIMETYLLATLSYQTMIASKAARVVTAAQGRQVVDFGARRAHGNPGEPAGCRARGGNRRLPGHVQCSRRPAVRDEYLRHAGAFLGDGA